MEVQNLEDEFVSLGRGEPEENDMLSTSSEILDPCATIVEEYVRAERRSLNPEDENEAHTASALLSSPSGDGVDVKQKSEEGCSENDFPAVSEDETMVTSSTELHSLANNVSGKIEPCSDIDAAEERAKEEMIMLLMVRCSLFSCLERNSFTSRLRRETMGTGKTYSSLSEII